MAIYYLKRLIKEAEYLGYSNDIKGSSVKGHTNDTIWHYYRIPFMKTNSFLVIKEVNGNKYIHHLQDEEHFDMSKIKNKVK